MRKMKVIALLFTCVLLLVPSANALNAFQFLEATLFRWIAADADAKQGATIVTKWPLTGGYLVALGSTILVTDDKLEIEEARITLVDLDTDNNKKETRSDAVRRMSFLAALESSYTDTDDIMKALGNDPLLEASELYEKCLAAISESNYRKMQDDDGLPIHTSSKWQYVLKVNVDHKTNKASSIVVIATPKK